MKNKCSFLNVSFNLGFILVLIGSLSYAGSHSKDKSNRVKINEVHTAIFQKEGGESLVLEIQYNSGGCDPKLNNPKIELELISIKDVTSRYARENGALPEYEVAVQVIVLEDSPKELSMCAKSYPLKVSADLRKLFKMKASSLGIDLFANKAHYSVKFVAPKVSDLTTFSAFE